MVTIMLEILSYGFFQRAIFSAVIIGTVCPLIGVFIILKGISFIGAGTAHAAFAGVAFGYLTGLSPALSAFSFSLVTVWLIGVLDIKGRMSTEVYIGIFYTITMAMAILFIGLLPGYNTEVYSYLFGSILTITPAELNTMFILGAVIVISVFLFFKELHFISMDYEMAKAIGIPTQLIYFLMLTLIATTVMVGLKAVGSLLIFAMMLIPAASAYQVAQNMKDLVRYSTLAGLSSTLGGLSLSYAFDLPSGATIILLAGLIFFACAVLSKKR